MTDPGIEPEIEPVTDGEFAGSTLPDFNDGVPLNDNAEPVDAEHGEEEA